MADKKISALTSATTPLAGTEVLPIVQGGATVKVTVDNLTAGKAVSMSDLTVSGVASFPIGTALLPSITRTGDTNTGIYFPAADTIAFTEGGVEAVRIDASGNVGIGTSSPTQKLQVAGNQLLANPGSAVFTYFDSTSNSIGRKSTGELTLTVAAGSPTVFVNNTTESMRIDSSGNVGIGTSSPAAGLDIVKSTIPTLSLSTSKTDATTKFSAIITPQSASSAEPEGVLLIGAENSASDNKIVIGGYFGEFNAATAISFYTANSLTTRTGTERMRISSTGIVTMSAYGAGAATFSAAGVISSVSDETWKIKDGVPVDPDSMLKKLEPGYWYYNDEKKETFGADRQLGFYAQNVNAAIGPEAAPTPEEGKPWGYYDRSVLAVTVMSLQKALATIESLTARITALENK